MRAGHRTLRRYLPGPREVGTFGAFPLQHVIEVRKIDERQARRVGRLDQLGSIGDPAAGADRGARSPKFEQGKAAEFGLQGVAQSRRIGPDVGYLTSVCRIHRPWRHGDVGARVHGEPPEQVRAGERRIDRARRIPHLRRLHQMVRLAPEPDFRGVPVVPAIADDAVTGRGQPRQHGCLDRARHRRQHRTEGRNVGVGHPAREVGHMRPEQARCQPDHV